MCLRHKYGKIENGYQYCQNCGKAIIAPCNHKYYLIKEIRMNGMGWTDDYIIIMSRCSICGEIRKDKSK